jgi:hypothetical protein
MFAGRLLTETHVTEVKERQCKTAQVITETGTKLEYRIAVVAKQLFPYKVHVIQQLLPQGCEK